MLKRFTGKAIAALFLTFPVAALADIHGSATIQASFTFSLDTGTTAANGDIRWSLATATLRMMESNGSARMFNLGNIGSAGFAALTSGVLTQLAYTTTSINGNNDSTNVLVAGDVFAVVTNGGNYAKVLVTGYVTDPSETTLQNIQIQYYTYGQAFPQLVVGPLGSDVWTTSIILNNTTSNSASFMVNFFQDNGQPLQLGHANVYNETHQTGIFDSAPGQNVYGTIAATGSLTVVLSSSIFAQGWATLTGPGVTGQIVFHRHTSAGADYEATVPVTTGGTQYVIPFDATSFFDGTNQIATLPFITGIALANLDPSVAATITCTILDPSGAILGLGAPISLQPMAHTAIQLNSASGFANVAGNIGALACSSNGPSFAVLGLRFLGGNDLTSFPAVRLQ